MKRPSPRLRRIKVLLLALAILSAGPARLDAIDLHGAFRGWIGSTSTNDTTTDERNQNSYLKLGQDISPWLRIEAQYGYNSFRSDFSLGPVFTRTSSEPQLRLLYNRPRFSALLAFQDRQVRTTQSSQDLDRRQFTADLDWRPSRGPRYFLRVRDGTSVLDPGAFGRETDATFIDLGLIHLAKKWSARYTLSASEVDNRSTGLKLEQSRNEGRLIFSDGYFSNRLRVGLDARLGLSEDRQEVPEGTPISRPVPLSAGLFSIDTTPELGELLPVPGLIDGDTQNPTVPRIEIGGANTFRNIGVDLGVTAPLSELEIFVDQPSGPNVIWAVYESPDNLSWFPVSGVQSLFDAGFPLYRVRFPTTTNRFFKVVNLSTNPAVGVAVTEIRGLVELEESGSTKGEQEQYWINFSTSYTPHNRVNLTVIGYLRSTDDVRSSLLVRDRNERTLTAQLSAQLSRTLRLRLGSTVSDLEETTSPDLNRREDRASASLEWRPLTTASVVLNFTRREERDDEFLLVSSDNVYLRGVTELLPTLRLTNEIGYTVTENPDFGFDQTARYWLANFDLEPTSRWILNGGWSFFDYDSSGTVSISFRRRAHLRATWLASTYLSLFGDWSYTTDDLGDSQHQRYGFQWTTGDRISLSASHYSIRSTFSRGVQQTSGNLTYKLNRWLDWWLTGSLSESAAANLQTNMVETYRTGLNLIF